MILAQTPLAWPEILNHSVAIGVVIFFGLGLTWTFKRLFGIDGVITKSSDRNAVMMEKYGETLVELKDLNVSQQQLCSAHAGSMKTLENFSGEMIRLHNDPNSTFATVGIKEELSGLKNGVGETIEHSKVMANQWGDKNHKEYRTPPLLDALSHTVDMLEKMEVRRGHADECREEFVLLRSQIADVKKEMTGG